MSDSPGRNGVSPEAPFPSAREIMSEEINAKVAQESAGNFNSSFEFMNQCRADA